MGKGSIISKVVRMVNHNVVEYYENDQEFGLNFKKPMDPKILIVAIKRKDIYKK